MVAVSDTAVTRFRLCPRLPLQSLWAWPMRQRSEPRGRPGRSGARSGAGHSSVCTAAEGEDTEHNKLKKRKNQSALQRLKDKIREKKQVTATIQELCGAYVPLCDRPENKRQNRTRTLVELAKLDNQWQP